jgi:hypothetical protein
LWVGIGGGDRVRVTEEHQHLLIVFLVRLKIYVCLLI